MTKKFFITSTLYVIVLFSIVTNEEAKS